MFTVRIAEVGELRKVMALYESMIDAMEHMEYKPGWKKGIYPDESYVREAIEKGELYVGLLDGEFTAAMILNHSCADGYERADWRIEAEPDEITVVHTLGVALEHQRQGLARKMIEHVLDLASQNGQKAIRLDVLAKNLPAKRFYESLGFWCCGEMKLFYEDTGLTEFYLYERAV